MTLSNVPGKTTSAVHLELDVCKDQHVIISFWSQVFHFKWPVPALFPTRPLDSLLRLQNSSKLKLSTHRPIPWVPMQQPDIVNFSVFISVALLYMDMPQPEPRVRVFETIIGALKPLLEACGRPPFLKAAFDAWASMTNSLVVLEKLHFPDLPPETGTSLALPPRHWGPCWTHDSVNIVENLAPPCRHSMNFWIGSVFTTTRTCTAIHTVCCKTPCSCCSLVRRSSSLPETNLLQHRCLLPWLLALPVVKLQLHLPTRTSLAWFFCRTNTEGQQQRAKFSLHLAGREMQGREMQDVFLIFSRRGYSSRMVCPNMIVGNRCSDNLKADRAVGRHPNLLQQWCDHAFPIAVVRKQSGA